MIDTTTLTKKRGIWHEEHHWIYRVLDDKHWSGRYAVTTTDGINAIFVSRLWGDKIVVK